jgi:transposase-like protein
VQANVPAALPKSTHPGVKNALAEIYNAENEQQATKAAKAFAADYGAKWPKAAAAKITDDLDVLLAFYGFPAEHWCICAPNTHNLARDPPKERTIGTGGIRQQRSDHVFKREC